MLYKYLNSDGIQALRTMTLLASDSTTFNDPFEVRPAFDQERLDYFAKTHESFYARLGFDNSLIAGGSMVGIPPENAVGFGEQIDERFRNELRKNFRVFCLSRNANNVVMWGHYTKSKPPQNLAHSGLVLGIDTSTPGLPSGIKPDGFGIHYPPDGSRPKLPLAYYQGMSVESYDLAGNIVNNPNELVVSDGGLHIPFSVYRQQVEDTAIAVLTTKDVDWAYEKEVRFIFDLRKHQKQLRFENGRYLVPLPPAALCEVIFGFHAAYELVQEVVQLFKAGRIGSPQLFYAWYHPYRYEVLKQEAKPDYLLDYYKTIKSPR